MGMSRWMLMLVPPSGISKQIALTRQCVRRETDKECGEIDRILPNTDLAFCSGDAFVRYVYHRPTGRPGFEP